MQKTVSKTIDDLFEYFYELGKTGKIDRAAHECYLTPDFQMVINGKVVVGNRDLLTSHFEHLFSQVSRIDFQFHEKIVADDKCVMRYDVLKPGKSRSLVIAIFTFIDGKICEMNEVVHSVDPKTEIDFMSR